MSAKNSAAESRESLIGAFTDMKKVPLPQSAAGRDELFVALRRWVEDGVAPNRIEIESRDGSVTMPLCPYPQTAHLTGLGAHTATASWLCG